MPRLYVLAGTNGSGKSSIGGAILRSSGADYFNPDEVALAILGANASLGAREANSAAWHEGKRLLETAIAQRLDFNFETTLGGETITRLLQHAIGFEVVIWYVGLASPELHLERVRARVGHGGHHIPEAEIRRRYDTSRLNLIELMPALAALRVYDNSIEADPASGTPPEPVLLLHMVKDAIVSHCDLPTAPDWVRPILAAALTRKRSRDELLAVVRRTSS